LTDHASQVKQVTYADDLTGAGKIRFLKVWWDLVIDLGPKVGYYPDPSNLG